MKNNEETKQKNFYNRVVDEKGTPLKQTKINEVKKKPTPWYKKFLFLVGVLSVITYFVANTKHGILRMNSQIKAIPSENQWLNYAECIGKQTRSCCGLPKVSFLHPPKETVVLLAKRGVGGGYLRYLLQEGTRVWTGSEKCNTIDQLHTHFYGGCAGPYHYKHYLLTRFFTPQAIQKEIGYNPTHLIHLTRNPFYALMSAYSYHVACEEGWNCADLSMGITDFTGNNTKRWITFTQNFATEWVIEYMYANSFNNTIRVYFEDLVKDRAVVLEPVLTFIANPLLQTTIKSLECVAEKTDPNNIKAKRSKEVNGNAVFNQELIKTLCKAFGPYWNEKKWGANICL